MPSQNSTLFHPGKPRCAGWCEGASRSNSLRSLQSACYLAGLALSGCALSRYCLLPAEGFRLFLSRLPPIFPSFHSFSIVAERVVVCVSLAVESFSFTFDFHSAIFAIIDLIFPAIFSAYVNFLRSVNLHGAKSHFICIPENPDLA